MMRRARNTTRTETNARNIYKKRTRRNDTTGVCGMITKEIECELESTSSGQDPVVGCYEEDHRGGTASEESEIIGHSPRKKKERRCAIRLFGTNSLKEGAV
jgi:hypothetical protein